MLIAVLVVISAAPKDLTVAAPGLTTVGLTPEQANVYLDYFAQQLQRAGGFTVISQSEIASLLGLERQRQLLGCDDNTSNCMAELSAALGTDALLAGSVAKSEAGYVVNLKVVATTGSGHTYGVFSERLSTEAALFDFLKASALELSARTRRPTAGPTAGGARAYAWLPAVGGGLLLGSGALLFGLAAGDVGRLQRGDATIVDVEQHIAAGKTKEALGWALGGAGLGALVAAGVMLLIGPAPVTLWMHGLGGFGFAGVLP